MEKIAKSFNIKLNINNDKNYLLDSFLSDFKEILDRYEYKIEFVSTSEYRI